MLFLCECKRSVPKKPKKVGTKEINRLSVMWLSETSPRKSFPWNVKTRRGFELKHPHFAKQCDSEQRFLLGERGKYTDAATGGIDVPQQQSAQHRNPWCVHAIVSTLVVSSRWAYCITNRQTLVIYTHGGWVTLRIYRGNTPYIHHIYTIYTLYIYTPYIHHIYTVNHESLLDVTQEGIEGK